MLFRYCYNKAAAKREPDAGHELNVGSQCQGDRVGGMLHLCALVDDACNKGGLHVQHVPLVLKSQRPRMFPIEKSLCRELLRNIDLCLLSH